MSGVLEVLGALAMAALYPAGVGAAFLWHQTTEGRRYAIARRDWARFAAGRGLTGGDQARPGGAYSVAFAGRARGRTLLLSAQTSRPVLGFTEVRATLHPPLDLGIDTASGALVDEPVRARPLFDLLAQARRPFERDDVAVSFVVEDRSVAVRYPVFATDPRSLDPVIEQLLDVCDAIDGVRGRIAAAGPLLGDGAAWAQFARQHGLQLSTCPLAMSGTLDGVAVSGYARRTGRLTHGLGAEARFSRPLEGGLGLVPTAAGAVAPWLGIAASDLGGEDVLLDDPPFDTAFLVRSREPARLARILDPELRQRILHMHERTPLLVDDLGVRVAAERLPSAAAMPALLEGLASLARTIEARVREESGSPYR